MKRKLICGLLLAFGLVSSPAFAKDITLEMNGEVLNPPVPPILEQGTTLVPIRIISQNLGANVQYHAEDRTIDIVKDNTEIHMQLDNKNVTVNGQNQELAVAPKSINGSTMVPIRFVTQNLDCTVNWDGATQTVSISTKDFAAPVTSAPAPVVVTPAPVVTTPAPVEETQAIVETPESTAKQPVFTKDGKHQVIDDEDFVVYVTDTGTKYHVDGCPSLSKSKHATTLGRATDAYYDACDRCNAPILNI